MKAGGRERERQRGREGGQRERQTDRQKGRERERQRKMQRKGGGEANKQRADQNRLNDVVCLILLPLILRVIHERASFSSSFFFNQRFQNCAARLVVRALPHVHITPILRRLHWLPVRAGISYKIVCLCLNAIISSTPAYLSDLLHLYSPSRSLRSSADTRLLKIPLYKCKTKCNCAFSYFGPSAWNSMPLHIRNATTIDTFISALKNLFLQPPGI